MRVSSTPMSSNGFSVGLRSPDPILQLGFIPRWKSGNRVLSRKKIRQRFPRASFSSDPLLVQAARGNLISRPPAWMMRQAGRYLAVYRKLAEKYPSFRERSETVDLIVEISLQPWRAFQPDGVIIFSDILTPLPAFGVPFEIEEVKGPIVPSPICSMEGLKKLHPIDLEKLQFVGESLRILRNEMDLIEIATPLRWNCDIAYPGAPYLFLDIAHVYVTSLYVYIGKPFEVGEKAAVLGFVGAPWTLATYIVEGGSTRTYTTVKSMCHTAPNILKALLTHLTQAISDYIIFQVNSGAQCIQIFDSWGGQLPPNVWEQWSKPYIEQMVSSIKKECPQIPLVLYVNGNGGLLERMTGTGVDVIGLDWTVDMADGRRRLGSEISVQGNVDPAYLFSPLPVLTDEIHRVVRCAGRRGHILNLGHGVLVKTPEEAVAHFFDVVKSLNYDKFFESGAAEELEPVGQL